MENAKWALDTRIATEQELTLQMIRLIAVDAVISVMSARFAVWEKCENGTGKTYCDGARVDTSNDTANCGQCGNKCSVDEECMSGRCV